MGTEIYRLLAKYYDVWNADLDYFAWADGIEGALHLAPCGRVESILDLGCGSGRMTLELARRGYDMIGVDGSPEMLSVARDSAERAGLDGRCLWLLQDLTDFELYGTVEAVISCLDTVNHLTSYADLRRMLSLVHNYLVPGGLFLFDLNSREKFENSYADRVYTFEDEDAFCIWQNDYHKKTHISDFYVTLFTRERDGRYRRCDEVTRERMYPLPSILRELRAAGFTPLSVGSSPYTDSVSPGAERLYLVARADKEMIV